MMEHKHNGNLTDKADSNNQFSYTIQTLVHHISTKIPLRTPVYVSIQVELSISGSNSREQPARARQSNFNAS